MPETSRRLAFSSCDVIVSILVIFHKKHAGKIVSSVADGVVSFTESVKGAAGPESISTLKDKRKSSGVFDE